MKLKITHDDQITELDLDIAGLFNVDDWDNQELALLESQIGPEKMEAWFARKDPEIPSFELINTLVWCRLSSKFPGLGLEDFRFKMGDLVAAIRDAFAAAPAATHPDAELEASLASLSDQPPAPE